MAILAKRGSVGRRRPCTRITSTDHISESAIRTGCQCTATVAKTTDQTLDDWFGTRNATSNYSFLYTAKGVASIFGGGLAAMLYQQFGSWSAAFFGSATLAMTAALMALALRATPLPRKKEAAAPAPAPALVSPD